MKIHDTDTLHNNVRARSGLLRTARAFGSVAPFGRSISFGRATSTSTAITFRWSTFRRPAAAHVFRELQQLGLAELAVFVRIELHRVFEKSFRVMRRRTIGITAPFWSASITASATGTASGWSTAFGWTTRIATASIGGWTIRSASTLRSPIRIASTSSAWSITSRSALPRTTILTATSIETASAIWTATGLWSHFVFGQFAVFVLIKRQQRGARVLDFIGRDHAVMIGIERFHDRRATATGTARTSGSTTLSTARSSAPAG